MSAVPLGTSIGAAVRRVPREAALHGSLAGAALCSWGVAMQDADIGKMNGYGLLAALPFTYYVALAILTGGFAIALSQREARGPYLALYALALIVVLHATTAVLYPEARYAWTYKHVGVVDYITRNGSVDRSIDIYHNWPGFFALNAWLSETAGIKPLDYAAWSQVAFELINVAALLFAVRGLTTDVRVRWLTVWVFLVANWIGQDYFAPQALGFAAGLVVIGLIVRTAPWSRPPRSRIGWALVRWSTRLARWMLHGRPPQVQRHEPTPVSARVALAVGSVCWLAVVVSHQLSPVMLLLAVGSLAVVVRRPPIWVVAAMFAIELWWVWMGYDFVSSHFGLFEIDPSLTARATAESLGPGAPGVDLGVVLSRSAMLLLGLLAVAGFVRRVRQGRWDSVPVTLAVAPVLLVGLQSYGGEGPLRIYLFALPWLAFFAATALLPRDGARSALARTWRPVGATAAIGVGALFGLFGQETTNYMTRADIDAVAWYYDESPNDARMALIAYSIPERPVASSARHLETPDELVQSAAFRAALASGDEARIRDRLVQLMTAGERERPRFLVWTPSQERYLRYHAITGDRGIAALRDVLGSTPQLRLVHRGGDGAVYRLLRPAIPVDEGTLTALVKRQFTR